MFYTGTISSCFGARLGALYSAFSSALVRYLHNLSGLPAFASLQPALHQQLISAGSERTNLTPLQVCTKLKFRHHKLINKHDRLEY